jgi:hypothetical protein
VEAEAAGRLSVLSGTVAGGSIGENLRSDIRRREEWRKIMKEAAAYFKDIQIKAVDTADFIQIIKEERLL